VKTEPASSGPLALRAAVFARRLVTTLRANPIGRGYALVALLMGAVGFLPLFGGPGYEHSLATGILCTPIACASVASAWRKRGGFAGALEASPRRDDGTDVAGAAFVRACLGGLGFAAVSLATAFVHLARVRACDPLMQIPYFVLTAGIGCVLAAACGVWLGEAWVRRRDARRWTLVLGALGLWIVGPAISVGRFWRSPMIFAFDPWVGYFSGTLYDTVVQPGDALYTYRLGSALSLMALYFAARLVGARARLPSWRAVVATHRAVAVTFSLLVAGSVVHMGSGTKLGHYQSAASIEQALGGRLDGARCTVLFPRATRLEDARLLLADCEAELRDMERTLATSGPPRLTAYFFSDAEEKRRLMGAMHTYIAKPWRHEVYLQLGGYPHPVLGHEIAHVVAGSLARGPFRIAGRWGGLLPDPGLIEGVATFASPDDDDLTDEQWARAMRDLEILPSMDRIFSLGFLGETSSKSYTAAGAFIRFVVGRFGMPVLQQWYGGASIESLTGKSLRELDLAFREYLDGVEFPPRARDVAFARFKRPGVFSRICPHLLDRLRGEADGCRDVADITCARDGYAAILQKDPRDPHARLQQAIAELHSGDEAVGRQALLKLTRDASVPKPHRDRASEAIAEMDLLRGDSTAAAARLRELLDEAVEEDLARSYEVKLYAAEVPEARAPIVGFLLALPGGGSGTAWGRPPEPLQSGLLLGRWLPHPMARYLLGKNLAQRALYTQASELLLPADRATLELLPLRVRREWLRQLAVVACARQDRAAVAELRASAPLWGADFAAGAQGRRSSVLRLLGRCVEGAPANPPAPPPIAPTP
jgi:hypothetical protein